MGHNDVAIGGAANTAAAADVGVGIVSQAIQDLYSDGARAFLIASLVALNPSAFNYTYVISFNAALRVELSALEGSLPDILLFRADLNSVLLALIGDLADNGYTGAPGTCTRIFNPFGPDTPGDAACEAELLASVDGLGGAVGDTYFSHDGIHFTTRVNNEVITTAMAQAVPEPPAAALLLLVMALSFCARLRRVPRHSPRREPN